MYKSDKIAEKIKQVAKSNQIQLKDMLSELKLNKNTMSNMYNGSMLKADNLAKIADYLNCSVDYMLGRTDIMEVNHPKKQNLTERIPHKSDMIDTDENIQLKLVGKTALGTPLEMVANNCKLIRIRRISKSNIKLYNTDIVVKMHDNSMVDAGIEDGDLAVIRPCPVAENGQIALVAVDGGSTLKKFYLTDGGVELHSCNSTHKIQKYGYRNDIRIIGTFVCTCEGDIIRPY